MEYYKKTLSYSYCKQIMNLLVPLLIVEYWARKFTQFNYLYELMYTYIWHIRSPRHAVSRSEAFLWLLVLAAARSELHSGETVAARAEKETISTVTVQTEPLRARTNKRRS